MYIVIAPDVVDLFYENVFLRAILYRTRSLWCEMGWQVHFEQNKATIVCLLMMYNMWKDQRECLQISDNSYHNLFHVRGRHGRDRRVVGFTTPYPISTYHYYRCEFESCSGEVSSIQHYLIKFVSDLRQVSGFLLVSQFPPPMKLTAMIYLVTEILLKVLLNNITLPHTLPLFHM